MKLNILKILIFSFSIGNSFAQNDVVKNNSTPIDSLDFKYCSAILSDLFENNDQKVSESVKCRKFFWCTECEGAIGCCQTFTSTYKNYLNNDLLVKINKADLEVKTGLYDEFDGDGNKGKKMEFIYNCLDDKGESTLYIFEFEKPDNSNFSQKWILVSIICPTH